MNVLIVDDETIMRKAYQTLINWEKSGFTLVASASNGQRALEIMRSCPIDIVITDLKMPVMSGLELIRAASEEFPHTRFVVMSSYDDFHLVKEAYSLGVKEYFLKIEMDSKVILQTLSKLKREIDEEKQQSAQQQKEKEEFISKMHEFDALSKKVRRSDTYFKEKFFKELIWGTSPEESIQNLKEHDILFHNIGFYVMVLSLPDYYVVEERDWKGERELLKYAILNILEELCGKYDNLYCFCNLPHEYIVLYNQWQKVDAGVKAFFDDFCIAIENCLKLSVDCGVSGPTDNYNTLKAIYQEAKQANDYSFVCGHGRVIYFHQIARAGNGVNVSEKIRKMKNLLRHTESSQMENEALSLRVFQNDICYDQVEEVKNLFYLYYIEFKNFMQENTLPEQMVEGIQKYNMVREQYDLNEMNKWLISTVREIAEVKRSRNGIEKVKNYIQKHYSEMITLRTAADLLEVSTGHLSRMFQKEEGVSFSQYLLNVRMNEAVRLLESTNLKIYEVARAVGYSNAEQFSKMFKKIIGKPPKVYQHK